MFCFALFLCKFRAKCVLLLFAYNSSHGNRGRRLPNFSGLAWCQAMALSNFAFVSVLGRSMPPTLREGEKLRIVKASTQSVALARSTQNPWVIAQVLVNHGMVMRYNQSEQGESYCEALAYGRAFGTHLACCSVWNVCPKLRSKREDLIKQRESMARPICTGEGWQSKARNSSHR
jgi:hypothetical protein